jgi:hypothetical protein
LIGLDIETTNGRRETGALFFAIIWGGVLRDMKTRIGSQKDTESSSAFKSLIASLVLNVFRQSFQSQTTIGIGVSGTIIASVNGVHI